MNQKQEEGHPLGRLEELAEIEGEREMGQANEQRESHPIVGIGHIRDKAKELHERISHLEDMLQPLLLPDSPIAKEPKDPSHTDPESRSSLMDSINTAASNVSGCISYVNGIISRLDL